MFNRKKFLSLIMILIFVLTLGGCSKKEQIPKNLQQNKKIVTTYPLKIVDSYNREIIIDKEPTSIISIAPNITETVFALGKGDKLVGRTNYCDYPKESKNIESIGEITEPNVEKIVSLKPDIVIASNLSKKEVLEKLEKLQIKVLNLSGKENFEDTYNNITKIGEVLNANQQAEKIVLNMKDKVKNIVDKVKDKNRPKVYYVIGYGKFGDYTAGGGTFIGNMIEMAGGDNVAKDVEGWKYSLEKVLEKNPDIIICSKYFNTKEGIKSTNGYKDLDAVKRGKLVEIDNNLLDRQGPRLADGLEELAKIIHPDIFK